jgi:methionyl-tRNA synthetase
VPQPQPSPDPALADSEEAMLYCPVCSMKLESRKCKLFCTQCGYYMSCADYY